MQALLIAVPQAVPGHGTDHQIHAMGGGHLVRVLAQRQGGYLHLRLLAPGNGHQGAQERAHILPQDLGLHKGINLLLHRPNGLLQHGFPIIGTDLHAGIGLHAVHELRQEHRPGKIQRHQLRTVEQQQIRILRGLGVGRDHVDAHHAGARGVQGNMTHVGQMLAAIAVFTKRQMAHRKPPLDCLPPV